MHARRVTVRTAGDCTQKTAYAKVREESKTVQFGIQSWWRHHYDGSNRPPLRTPKGINVCQ